MSNYDAWLITGPGGPHDDDCCGECYHCDGPLLTLAARESGECDECWKARQDATNEINDEFDRMGAEAHDEPAPACCGEDELPF